MSLTNVPTKNQRNFEMQVEVRDNNIYLWSVCKSDLGRSKMETFYVGDHMLLADNHKHLLEMLGREMIHLIESARDIGYRQAQVDIKMALGL